MKITINVSDDFYPEGGDMLVYNKSKHVWEVKQPSVVFKTQNAEIKSVEKMNADTCAKVVEMKNEYDKKISDLAVVIKNYIK